MPEDGSESLSDFLDRAIIESEPDKPPADCCTSLAVNNVTSKGTFNNFYNFKINFYVKELIQMGNTP